MVIHTIGKIFSVDEIFVYITRTKPPWLIVHALGRTATTGWSNGTLSKYVYLTPPDDGVQEFDFIADTPASGSQVLNVLTPISAHAELSNIDIDNYWGKGLPLMGVRVIAVSNSKELVLFGPSAADMSEKPAPMARARYVSETGDGGVPGFEEDIKPLFRPRDVTEMIVWGGFDLHKYEDVKTNAEKIQKRLNNDMPCDGLWPNEERQLFAKWKEGGMPA